MPRMPLDLGSPLHRYRVDPRVLRREALDRLAALGVASAEISPAVARSLLARFVRDFVDPTRRAALEAKLATPPTPPVEIDFDHWLRPECVHPRGVVGCLRWLREGVANGPAPVRCVRFERTPGLPPLSLELATMDDTWAASWPGVFVSFATARAVVVTLDYEEVRCDVRAARGTPYR